jgi:hypothetical protein
MIHRSPPQITVQARDFHIIGVVSVFVVYAFKGPLRTVAGIFVEEERLFFTIETRHFARVH